MPDFEAMILEANRLATLLITHNLAVVRHVAEHMAIMKSGRFVESGPTDRIFGDPAHDYTKRLLSAHLHVSMSS